MVAFASPASVRDAWRAWHSRCAAALSDALSQPDQSSHGQSAYFPHTPTHACALPHNHVLPSSSSALPSEMTSDADQQLASSFARLPTELLSRIARPLSTTDFCALRSTCKLVDHKLLNEFAYEFFRKKQFMMTSASLQALKDISNSRFSDYLSHVVIGTDQLFNSKWDGSITIDDKRKYRATADEQKLFGHIGCASKFEDAIAGLSRLETLDIRDFNSATRFRDGQFAQWRSYGVAELRKAGTVGFGNLEWATCIYQNILLGAAAANARIKSLEVISKRNGCLHDSSLSIAKPMAPNLSSLLSGLTKLHLDIMANWEDLKFVGLPNLCYLLQNTPNVEWLRLNIDMALSEYDGTEDKGWIGFLQWLAKEPPSSDVIAKYTPAPTFELKQLDLGRIVVSPDRLLAIVAAYPSLKTLALSRSTLTEPSGTTTPPADAGTAYLVKRVLTGLDNTSVEKFIPRALIQRTSEGRGDVQWNSRGTTKDSIQLRGQPGQSEFKDAASLISFRIHTPACKSMSVSSLIADYYPASDDDSASDDGDDGDEDESDGGESNGDEDED